MICPKCGYSQEERLDCKKCGVVFTKYYALHPEAAHAANDQEGHSSSTTASISDELDPQEVAEFREHLKDLNRVLNEFEFERAERNRIRGEIKVLDQKIQDMFKECSNRFDALEAKIPAPSSPESQSRSDSPPQGLTEVESRLGELEETVRSLRSNPAPPATGSIAVELDTLFKEIDDLRTSLQNVSVRYSEIGELKKNFLILTNRLDSLGPEIASAKETSSKGSSSKKVAGLEQEVTALRAELRQALEQTEAARSSNEVQVLHARVEQVSTSIANGETRLEAELGTLSDKLSEARTELGSLREEVRTLSGGLQSLEQQQQRLDESAERIRQIEAKINAISNQPPPEPQSLLEADVRAIRMNLDGLLRRLGESS